MRWEFRRDGMSICLEEKVKKSQAFALYSYDNCLPETCARKKKEERFTEMRKLRGKGSKEKHPLVKWPMTANVSN